MSPASRWCPALLPAVIGAMLFTGRAARGDDPEPIGPLAVRNLVAWCIVPFDAEKRGPEERVAMLKRLGLRRVAYDWRAEHVATFEAEIEAYAAGDVEFFAFWSWHPSMEALVRKHGITPQIWRTCPSPKGASPEERVTAAVRELLPLVEKAGELNCRFGLYNHGGWGGQPENLFAVCKALRERHDAEHVGIVYNFHHGHEHLAGFAKAFERMQPYLLCVNLNGMADPDVVRGGRDKILPIGTGEHEARLLRIVLDSGYEGPFGILDHRSDTDAEVSLRANIDGLRRLTTTIRPEANEAE